MIFWLDRMIFGNGRGLGLPYGEYRDSQGKCWRWNVIRSDNFVGISPKIWLCSDGRVLHDQSGVRLPVIVEKDDE